MKIIYDWWDRDAEWWQFWRPMSGPAGGAILGIVVGITIVILLAIFK